MASPCSNYDRDFDWEKEEEELNKRMNIIGQNGNTGEHYPEFEDEDK
jgi:hypothetical protein